MDPINYSGLLSGVTNPLEMVQAAQAGQAYRQQQAMQQQALQDQQAAREQQALLAQQYQQDLQAATAPGADPRLLAQLSLKYPSIGHEKITGASKLMGDSQKQEMVNTLGRTLSFLQSGRSDLALGNLQTIRDGYANAGRDTSNIDQFIATVKADPKAAIGQASIILAQAAPDEYQKLQSTPAMVQKAGAEAKVADVNAKYADQEKRTAIQAQLADIQHKQNMDDAELQKIGISREELGIKQKGLLIDLAKLKQGNRELPPALQNKQLEFIDAASEAQGQADQAQMIVDKLNTAPPSTWGRMTGEWWNNTFGTDYASFRNQMTGMLNKAVLANKPGGGTVSDSDMKFMARGVPSPDASPDTLKEFFTRYNTIQKKIAAGNNLKSAWIEQNRGYGKLTDDLTLDNGAIIPAGTSLTEANKMIGRLIDSGKLSGNSTQSGKSTDKNYDYFATGKYKAK